MRSGKARSLFAAMTIAIVVIITVGVSAALANGRGGKPRQALASSLTSSQAPAPVAMTPSTPTVPSWMTQCLEAAHLSMAGTSRVPVLGSTAAIVAARAAHSFLNQAPAAAVFADVTAPAADVNAGDALASVFDKGPVWLVGFSGLRIAAPGGVPTGAGTAPRFLTGWIVVVNDPTGSLPFAVGCRG